MSELTLRYDLLLWGDSILALYKQSNRVFVRRIYQIVYSFQRLGRLKFRHNDFKRGEQIAGK